MELNERDLEKARASGASTALAWVLVWLAIIVVARILSSLIPWDQT